MTAAWKADAKRLVRAVTRDESLPVYLVERSDADDRFDHIGENIAAISGVFTDLKLRDLIGSEWQGRGFATLIWSGLVRCNFPEPSRFERQVLGIIMHELGHWADSTSVESRTSDAEMSREELLAWVRLAQTSVTRDETQNDAIDAAGLARPWDGHGLDWIRLVIHIAHRATEAGFRVEPADLTVAGQRYGLSHADAYRFALGDEPIRLADVPLVGIPFHPMPDRMDELFAQDLERYEQSAAYLTYGS